MNHSLTVDVENLGYRYPGAGADTLHELGFTLKSGEIYGFLGPSGAGKSTTQKILYRLLPGYTGSVRIGGREIGAWGRELYRLTGIGFETPNLYLKLTGRENLEFALALHNESSGDRHCPDIDAAAGRLGLQDAVDSRVESYSKGMRMRLAFIRAVLHQPKLLFLDEPTSGLDPLWARQVKDWIQELKHCNTAVFLTTHSMELADELCDTVGFLVDGRLAVQDRPELLKRRHGKPGCVVSGRDAAGAPLSRTLSYEELRRGSALPEFGVVESVRNREHSLEQVFIELTGRSLTEASVADATGASCGPAVLQDLLRSAE
jgi:fluoroquinolone transport system ATP-binding protein